MVGQIIGGKFDEIWIRKKSDERIEIGELLVCDDILLEVYDQEYASLMEQREIARISGMALEDYGTGEIRESEIRNYTVMKARPVFDLQNRQIPKTLPRFMGRLERVRREHLSFIANRNFGLYVGQIRSGTRTLNIPVYLDPAQAMSHHILVAATTGRGKSNFMKVMLWNLVGDHRVGTLVMDAHNEYYFYTSHGQNYGLSQHPDSHENVHLYTPNPRGLPGEHSLRININRVRPSHLKEIVNFSNAQEDALFLAYREWGANWIMGLLTADSISGVGATTLAAIQRKIMVALNLEVRRDGDHKTVVARGNIFSVGSEGESTINDIVSELDRGRIVIIDTSTMSSDMEIMIAGMITREVFHVHRECKEGNDDCVFSELPVVSAIIEEAPRVLGGDSGNIFKEIAREGRKFKIGIVAITQLPSMIPKEIMANLNTKIILGNDTESERKAIISSTPQDMSKASKMISSLDRGEAIISSIFTRFAIPVRMDLFEDVVDRSRECKEEQGERLIRRQLTL